MRKGIMEIFHSGLIVLDHRLENSEKLLRVADLLEINSILLPGELLILYPEGVLVEGPELLLRDLPVLLVLEPLISGESVGRVEEGVSDLVYYVLAGKVERVCELCLQLVEVVVNRLL